jgi:hypothetical protein
VTTVGGRVDRVAVVPGHDGTAELFVEVRFDDGRRSGLTFAADVIARIVDAEGLDSVEQLVGSDWTVLVGGADGLARLMKGA